MTNYEIIKKYLEHGFWAVIKGEYWYYIWTSIMSNWLLRCSDTHADINKCFDSLWSKYTSSIDWVNRQEYSSITPIYPPFTPYKVGDLVDVLETAMDIPWYDEWDDKTKSFVGIKWVTINEVTSSWYILSMKVYDILNKYWSSMVWFISNNQFAFPHHVLAPHISEEISTIEIGGLKYNAKEVEDRVKGLDPIQK